MSTNNVSFHTIALLCAYLSCSLFCNSVYSANQSVLIIQNDEPVGAFAFSQDGEKLLTGWSKSSIWDLKTGLKLVNIPSQAAASGAFSKNGKMVATGTSPLSAAVWNTETGEKIQTFKGKDDSYLSPETITAVAFHPTESKVIAGTEFGNISLWDIYTGKETPILNIGNFVDKIQVFSDGDRISTYMDIISLKSKVILHEFDARITLSSDEKYLFSGKGNFNESLYKKQLLFFSANDYSQMQNFPVFESKSGNCSFSPDGTLILLYEFGDDFGNYDLTKIQLMRVANNEIVHEFKIDGKNDYVISKVLFSPDGKKLAIVSDKTIYIWDIGNLYSSVPESANLKQ